MQRDDSIHERLADRLANILTKLNMGYQLSIKELASEFGVSTRTISRDFDRINTYLPLLQDNENKKFYLDLNYLGKIAPKDIRNFAQLSGISHLYPSLDMSFLRELLDSRAHQIYSAKGYSFEDASQFKELFKVLGKAIQEQRQIGFLYKGESRLVQPYRLIHHHGSWYLAAVRKDQLRTYRISHIQLMHATHEYPQFIPDQDIVKVVEDDDSIWFGQDKQEIILSIDSQVAFYFKQRSILPEQQIVRELGDGGLLVSSKINHDMQLLPLIRFWIPHLKIVNPERLQDEMEKGLKEYLERRSS
ncbi:WYL domain-containing transcriptional regulator [Acinetobacter johnsonii]|jgi:predicted DNA-binding transcriptional regulator YafY|uniref:WYL domain-containing protein n=1 Tax=Acinetobacter johnsonii TaxID=40214 RepID=A0A427UKD6_ACIJO|nr:MULTISPECIES: WYL domain-containing transcriptional regulator [Acinetobacter]MBP8063504.1 WYL domain-containing protein [Acinetobacter sp.]MBP8888187.1 WYL domain-containing protein [Flavobacterium sp.]RSE18149.1 WYL domain-containing protein [Acinetobacter johnsonii]WQN46200.1 WYL domain-containing transcriptional regulator [Acinetobacter johnsonii]